MKKVILFALVLAGCAPSSARLEQASQERSKSIVVAQQEYQALYLSTTGIIYMNKATGLTPGEEMAAVRAGENPFSPISIAEARMAALVLTRREEGRDCTITDFEQSAETLVRLEFRC
ncbi:hypothetical protein [Nereida sp. MMG025]|uniref:hypothetical protein n=1 Tax=Nereida sp. MMG025 TaxID=2909981 RepID=UPI001F22C540|nr:hypothetical protein [Nereida sp. MMG025]MCF6443377.1 hypothetical protein [Nereida sp. MMG025]